MTILDLQPLGFPWETLDPFLATMHHNDAYPAGDERMAPPRASLMGRRIGADFANKDGWNMYHGDVVPGFPSHPHRGFETVTIVRRGFIDHSDSLGAAARFGRGDVQWLTAGKGIVHSEMFPLLDRERGNHVELFQIWLNLPRENKLVEPHFSMLWADKIPARTIDGTTLSVIAGSYSDATAPAPPPKSWAARADADVAIWTLKMEPGARFTLPRTAAASTNRALYFFAGSAVSIDGATIESSHRVVVRADVDVAIENTGADVAELLLLQGKPIAEPVAQYGPFVMNTRAEIEQAFIDYERTRFGGWPWKSDGPVHERERGHWARWPDGHEERAPDEEARAPG